MLDASVVVALVVAEPGSERARQAILRGDELVAPDWMMTEVASAIAGKVRYQELSLADAAQALDSTPRFIDRFVATKMMLKQTISLAAQIGHPFYDCLYLAVALDEEAVVVTADRTFVAKAVTAGFADKVELLA